MCIYMKKKYRDFVQDIHFVLSVIRVLGIYSESWAIQSLCKKGQIALLLLLVTK